ncbi:MAG: FAD-binding oxidoreductase [Saprospiraceae bacterium]
MKTTNLSYDYLIVGGGIAGCLMAYKLRKLGFTVIVIAKDHIGSASTVSSGLINPITGLRFVKTWNYELLVSVLLKFYKELEAHFGFQFIYHHDMIVCFDSVAEENNWQLRMADQNYQPYCKLMDFNHYSIYNLNANQQYGLIENIIRIDIPLICSVIQKELNNEQVWRDEAFDHSKLEFFGDKIKYNNLIEAKQIIFCEGHKVNNNPLFDWLPIVKLKGERLRINCETKYETILHSKYTIIPNNNELWIGSNYSLTDQSYQITSEEAENQMNFTTEWIDLKKNLIEHSFGFRPASRDRRPVLGRHPNHANVLLINGLGTKGASLAPYCVELLIQHLLEGVEIAKDLNTKRFVKNMT